MIITFNSLPATVLILVLPKSPVVALSYCFIWDKFLCLLILFKSFSLFLCGKKKSAMSPVLEGNGLIGRDPVVSFLWTVPCIPGPGISGMSTMCAVYALLFCPCYFILQVSHLQRFFLFVVGIV